MKIKVEYKIAFYKKMILKGSYVYRIYSVICIFDPEGVVCILLGILFYKHTNPLDSVFLNFWLFNLHLLHICISRIIEYFNKWFFKSFGSTPFI
jgi:hypothetical protein